MCLLSHACLNLNLYTNLMNHTHLISYVGYGGGGGGGGFYWHEAITVNYHDSMTINVNAGDRGNGSRSDNPSYRAGFAGSAGKVFLVSKLTHVILLIVFMSLKLLYIHHSCFRLTILK